MGHFMPLSLSKVGACFCMATLVRWMKVLVMSSRFMLKRQLVKRAKPLLQADHHRPNTCSTSQLTLHAMHDGICCRHAVVV